MSNIFLEKLYKKIALLEENNIDIHSRLDKLKDEIIDYKIRTEMLETDYLNLYNNKNKNITDFCTNRIYKFLEYTCIIEFVFGIILYKLFRYFII